MYTRILAPTDGTKLSARAVAEATQLAAETGARLVLLHVLDPFDAANEDDMTTAGIRASRELRKARLENGETMLKAVAKLAEKKNVSTSFRVVEDYSPYEAIIKAAKKDKCDLIVMASHGRRGLAAVVVGSETQKVLTHTTIPVLVVR